MNEGKEETNNQSASGETVPPTSGKGLLLVMLGLFGGLVLLVVLNMN